MQTTRLNRPWFFKVAIFFVIFVGFGLWGWYEAVVTYPQRGIRYADTRLYEYLKAEKASGGSLTSRVSVPDPAGEMARLKGASRSLTEAEQRKLEWLESLEIVGRVKPQYTTIADPDKKFAELDKQWSTGNMPKKLEWYDIPAQWAFVVIGIGGGLWLLILFAMVARVRYGWEESTKTLTLPGGQTLTPADLDDVDKRKWDKYIVFLKVKPSHAGLGGREVRVDLYRYTPLEEWVLEMERTAFPERAEEKPPEDGAAGAGDAAPEQEAKA
jgi:hypothetical protein